jgi:hypothetical protein
MESNQISSFTYKAELTGEDESGNWHIIRTTEASHKDLWDNRALKQEADQFVLNESFTYERIRLNISSSNGSSSSCPVSILKDGKQVLYADYILFMNNKHAMFHADQLAFEQTMSEITHSHKQLLKSQISFELKEKVNLIYLNIFYLGKTIDSEISTTPILEMDTFWTKHSCFRSIRFLIEYIHELLSKEIRNKNECI